MRTSKTSKFKRALKKVVPQELIDLFAKLKYSKRRSQFRKMEIKHVFTHIYDTNHWGNGDSISGPGSSVKHTELLVDQLKLLLDHLNVKTILDIPCGDFNWMQHLQWSEMHYIGGDIVKDLIFRNRKQFGTENINFDELDLTSDALPVSDVIINRDCFVHFSYEDIRRSLKNICRSKSHYLLSTTFLKHKLNYDIVTGDWRPLNLELSPFKFPNPVQLIMEHCEPGYESQNRAKALALWKIEDLRSIPFIANEPFEYTL